MAPRATRFRAVDDSPLAFSLPRKSKVALKSILRGGASQQKRREQKKVSFGDVETKDVEKWIGIVQVCCLPLDGLQLLTYQSGHRVRQSAVLRGHEVQGEDDPCLP